MSSQQEETKCRIGIIADTHDHLANISRALEIFREKKVELIIHAGDFVSPFALAKFRSLKCSVIGIFGNNEGEKPGMLKMAKDNLVLQDAPLQYRFHEYFFFITHIPFDFSFLANTGLYTAIIYGHTHKPDIRKGKTMIINPGECCGWVEGRATVAILELPEREVTLIDL